MRLVKFARKRGRLEFSSLGELMMNGFVPTVWRTSKGERMKAKLSHDTVKDALRVYLEEGKGIEPLPPERVIACYSAFPCSIGAEVPGLRFGPLASGYAPLLTLSDSSQVDDCDLLNV